LANSWRCSNLYIRSNMWKQNVINYWSNICIKLQLCFLHVIFLSRNFPHRWKKKLLCCKKNLPKMSPMFGLLQKSLLDICIFTNLWQAHYLIGKKFWSYLNDYPIEQPLGPHRSGSRPSPTSGSGLLEDSPTC
jgi:hypothetical protein